MMKAPEWVHEMADKVWADYCAAREKRGEILKTARQKGQSRTVAEAKAYSFHDTDDGLQFVMTMEDQR